MSQWKRFLAKGQVLRGCCQIRFLTSNPGKHGEKPWIASLTLIRRCGGSNDREDSGNTPKRFDPLTSFLLGDVQNFRLFSNDMKACFPYKLKIFSFI